MRDLLDGCPVLFEEISRYYASAGSATARG
jgi:hypothetical protein